MRRLCLLTTLLLPQLRRADGRVITIRSDWGTDYAFLSKDLATAKVADISFQGTAASIQNRGSNLVLALGGLIALLLVLWLFRLI